MSDRERTADNGIQEKNRILLEARHLVKEFPAGGTRKNPQVVHAVTDVNLEICEGETLALVGESGCGKSTLGRVLIRLLEPTAGEILYQGKEIVGMKEKEFAALRVAGGRLQSALRGVPGTPDSEGGEIF